MANPHSQSAFRERKKYCSKCGRPLVSDVSKKRNICGLCERVIRAQVPVIIKRWI